MRNNIVTARIKDGTRINTEHVYQYDYGLRLVFEGVELPEFYEVHFINKNDSTALVVHGDPTGVDIPDICLQTGEDIIAWMYIHTDVEDGESVYEIHIPVMRRPNISDEPIEPVERREIDEVMAELRRGVALCDADAEKTAEDVVKTAQNVLHYPYINQDDKHWMVWDANEDGFVDTGIEAIGERGKLENMRIGTVETLPSGAQATASVDVGDNEIILNLGLPSGDAQSGIVIHEEQSDAYEITFPYGANNVATDEVMIRIEPYMTGSGEPGPRNVRRIIPWEELLITHNNTVHAVTFGIPGGVVSGEYNPETGKLTLDRVMVNHNCINMDNQEYQPGWQNAGIRDLVGPDVHMVFTGQTLNIGTTYGIDTTDGKDLLYLDYDLYGKTQTQWMATEINVQVCIQLAEPIEYDLQSIMLPTALGENTYSVNAGKFVHMRYPCDTKLYIDHKITALEALILEHE